MKKEDEEFLRRVEKEAPELLDASVEKHRFQEALDRMLKAPPVSPAERQRVKPKKGSRPK